VTSSTGDQGKTSRRPAVTPTEEQARTIARLLNELAEVNITTRQRARNALVAMGEPALPLMLDRLATGNFLVRWEITKALAEMRLPGSVPGLIRALEDDEQDVRWMAAVALAAIGRDALAPLIEAMVERLSSLFLRQGVHHVLSIYRDPELHDPLLELRDALGPMEDDEGIIPATENALRALRG